MRFTAHMSSNMSSNMYVSTAAATSNPAQDKFVSPRAIYQVRVSTLTYQYDALVPKSQLVSRFARNIPEDTKIL
jgi:hypothetical protein